MNNVNYARFASFAEQNILCNQTHVVHTLLKTEKKLDLQACLYNMYTYTIGPLIDKPRMPEQQFYEKIDSITQELRALKMRKEELLDSSRKKELEQVLGTIKKLELDLDTYEHAPHQAKEILEWWLIPFWLSEKLIAKGETILRAYDCNWWGRTYHKKAVPLDAVLRQIEAEIIDNSVMH